MADLEAKFMVAGKWDFPRKVGAGMDGQFASIEDANSFVILQDFDEATVKVGANEGTLTEKDGVKGWNFPTLEKFIPLEAKNDD